MKRIIRVTESELVKMNPLQSRKGFYIYRNDH